MERNPRNAIYHGIYLTYIQNIVLEISELLQPAISGIFSVLITSLHLEELRFHVKFFFLESRLDFESPNKSEKIYMTHTYT